MARIITDVGLNIIANRIKGLSSEPLYLGWGSGSTAPANGDTQLQTEDVTGGYARIAAVSSIVTLAVLNDTYQLAGTLTSLANQTITEWGVFDAIANGNLVAREVVVGGFTLTIGLGLNFILKLQAQR